MTPALDALLKGVDTAAATGHVEYFDALKDAAPRLAAMLRVAVEALVQISAQLGPKPGCGACCKGCQCEMQMSLEESDAALGRIERIAAGESGPPEGRAMAKGS